MEGKMKINQVSLFVTFAFVTVLIVTNAKAQQPYSCQFLTLISDATKLQNEMYKEYILQEKKSPKKVTYSSSIDVSPEYAKKNGNVKSVFDNKIFHMSDKILLVDTFRFFNESCKLNDEQTIDIVYAIKDTALTLLQYRDIVVLKSIRTYGRYLIIALQHIDTTFEQNFYFNLIANYPPVLDFMTNELGSAVTLR
ncbi:MAG: hypothetical protein EOO44_20560, partial [Flavobacterium sp.]